jgi:hypothetical protein
MAEIFSSHVRHGGGERNGAHHKSPQSTQGFSSTVSRNYVIPFGGQMLTSRMDDVADAED